LWWKTALKYECRNSVKITGERGNIRGGWERGKGRRGEGRRGGVLYATTKNLQNRFSGDTVSRIRSTHPDKADSNVVKTLKPCFILIL
jgi:hypothetical protein